MDDLHVRRATPLDARPLAVLHVETWQAAYRGLLPDAYLDSLDVEERARAWGVVLDVAEVLVAAPPSGLLGFVSCGDSRDEGALPGTGEVYGLYVRPSVWGTGVGRRLHDAAVDLLHAAGHREATLWVLQGNRRAEHFYRRQGWSPDGGVQVDQRPDVRLEEVRLRRSLP